MDRRVVPYYAASVASGTFVAWVAHRIWRDGLAPDSLLPVFGFFGAVGVIMPMLIAGMLHDDARADGFGLGLMGLMFLAAGAFAVQDLVGWRLRSQPAEAVVVDVVEEPDTPGPGGQVRRRFVPILEYTAPDGAVHRITGSTSVTVNRTQSGWRRGERVTIRVDPGRPGKGRQGGVLATIGPFLFLAAGFGIMAFAVQVARRKRRIGAFPGAAP
jgi:hypothetical protein